MTRGSPGKRRSTTTRRSMTRGMGTPNSACSSGGRRIISAPGGPCSRSSARRITRSSRKGPAGPVYSGPCRERNCVELSPSRSPSGRSTRPGPRGITRSSNAQVAGGLGEDVGNFGQEERTRWRKQAHAWLELDLAAWAGKLNDGIPDDRRLLRSTLMRWLADPDLAALREPGELKMLPVEERDEWLAFWKEVDALIKRAAGA